MGQKAILIDLMTATVQEVTVKAPLNEIDFGIYLDIRHAFKNGDVLITELRVPGVLSGRLVPNTCVIDGVQGIFKQSCLVVNPSGSDAQTSLEDMRKRVKFRRSQQY